MMNGMLVLLMMLWPVGFILIYVWLEDSENIFIRYVCLFLPWANSSKESNYLDLFIS